MQKTLVKIEHRINRLCKIWI